MSKELEDLDCGEEVKTKYGVCYAYSPDVVEEFKQALQRLESIDNAKPSGALESLERLKSLNRKVVVNNKGIVVREEIPFEELYSTIKQALIKAEEDRQFMDLILNKPQLLGCFAYDGVMIWEVYEETYNDSDKEYINATKEEFEFMRAMLIKKGKIDNE